MNYDNYKLDTPDRYEIDDEDGGTIPHDPDEDEFDHDCDTQVEGEGEEREYDLGDPVGADPLSDEEAAWWREQNRLSYEQSVRTRNKGD